ncbi:uncharacterized protein K452DRAFT_98503 [Aplosporella prunicola CBS 121167]|uniref:MYND-type domain-containing protein n=1 Tax=Aplosporella prunicola CBS 121167 TaxID=1176127 RepID=A0A6A6B4B8_9PEZI|nr:uncharacterized protein K452DRAFT_98503 [Aplosporella prunicola CBS 121167]KAF2137797.1 hypothetical protein K452DRAFT_98503 [Aplosporella prunicola CBS 121167]
MFADLRNDLFFPDFSSCPDENDISLDFYTSSDGFRWIPKHHWCLLGEIVDVTYFLRLRLLVRDRSGLEVPVAFYPDAQDPLLDYGSFRKGHTLAILYAHQHGFLDLSVGIRQETMSAVRVIPFPLHRLLALSDTLQTRSEASKNSPACHTCQKESNDLLKCSRCGITWYCNKTCQQAGWRERGHKDECGLLRNDTVKETILFDWKQFKGFVHFPLFA